MASVCVYEKTCPTCSEPLTVGGGVSMENTSSRGRDRSNRYTPLASHRAAHLSSRPSSAGLSGTEIRSAGSWPSGIAPDPNRLEECRGGSSSWLPGSEREETSQS